MAIRKFLSMLAAVLVMVLTVVAIAPNVAYASAEGRKNTAIGLTAGSILGLVTGHVGAGLVLGAGSAYAWHRYNQARQPYYYSGRYGTSYYTPNYGHYNRYGNYNSYGYYNR